MTYRLKLLGSVPSKKNRNRRSRNGGLHLPEDVRTALDGLELQARAQWSEQRIGVEAAMPLIQADIRMDFHVATFRGDLDNKYTAVQDVLVKAGVLFGDSMKRVSKFSARAVRDIDEYVMVELET